MRPESRLSLVTITGADDSTHPEDLVALSLEFPFVEWGLLQSLKRGGTPRYPSSAWLLRAAYVFERNAPKVSLHFCGALAREIYEGKDTSLRGAPPGARVQVNGFLPTPEEWARGGKSALQRLGERLSDIEIIFQVGGPQTLGTADIMAERSPNFSALHDPSGGRGTSVAWPPPKWTEECSRHVRLGFAGGIGPENVVSVVQAIRRVHPREFWIDMESNVRTDDKLDLVKVRKVLWLCASLVADDQEADGG